jgi:hypothetical protein
MDEQHHIVSPGDIPFNPKRKNARAAYPWHDLEPGFGFVFRSGTSYFYARNQCSFYGTQLGRKFRAYEDVEKGLIWAVRVDGVNYEIGRMGDGTPVRPITKRMEFLPLFDDPVQYRERVRRDALCEQLKQVCEGMPLEDWEFYVESMKPRIAEYFEMKAKQNAAAETAEGPSGDGEGGARAPPDLI